jgi:hypothetical protein
MAMEGSSMINAYTEGATQIWFDRVITQGREFPNRLFASITLTGCNSCGVLNSAMYGIGGWLAIDPVTNKYVVYNTSPGSTTGYALEVTSAQNLLVQNNYMEGNGILIFAQDNKIDTGWPIAANHTIRGNEFVTPPSRLAGGPASDHMYHAHRHHIEYKSGIAVRIDGNIFRGAYADELPNGNAIAISVRQQTGTHLNTYVDGLTHAGVTRDFTIVNNYFHTNAGVLKIAYDSDTRRYGTEPVRRIEFSNNIIHNQDWYHMRSLPNSNSYNEVIVSYSSGEMIGANPSHGMIIRNNTQIHQNGMSPIWLGLAGWNIPWSQVIVLDNLFQDNRTGNYPPGGMGMGVITWAGTVKDSWQHISSVYTPSGPAGDPNSFWAGNMFVGGSENNQEYGFWDYSCYPSAGAFCNWSQAEVDAYWGTGSNALGTYVSSTQTFAADTPTGRENEVGYHSIPTGNYRAKTDAPVQPANGKSYAGIGVGANMNVIMQAAQRHSNLRALTVRATSADIGWTAPVAGAACYLSCPTCTATRQLNNAATLDRKSTLSGLTAATNYSVSVTCGNLDELLTFRTP